MLAYTSDSAYPWKSELERFRTDAEQANLAEPSGWDRSRKIALIEEIVRAYSVYQQENGAVVDPFSGRERYYSTPAYAFAAAVLVKEGRTDLLSSASAALTHSISLVVRGEVPDNHADFFPILMLRAYVLLQPLMPEQATQWAAGLKQIQPEETYVFTMSKMNNPNRMINWNAIMISGEYLRYREQLASEGIEWMDQYLKRYHLPRFTGLGLYQDGPLDRPNSPLAYDIATRYHLGLMLDAGYDESCASSLDESIRRGAFTSLLTLSPLGEIPPRGRSSQHQWNEAAAAYVFSSHASAAKQIGDPIMAGVFARAANLCFAAVDRWKMEDGRLNIVRNRYAPEVRHGYEIYTNHTCYNLWTVAALANAYLCDPGDEVAELPIPSEIGSRVLQMDGWFETITASVPGQQIVLHTALNDPYTVPGLVRIHQQGLPGLIGPAAAGHAESGFTEFSEGETKAISYCPAWRTPDGQWYSLSEGIPSGFDYDRDAGINPSDGGGVVVFNVIQDQAQETNTFTVDWVGPLVGLQALRTVYTQQPGLLTVTYEFEGEIEAAGAVIPLMFSDGEEQAVITVSGDHVRSEFCGAYVESTVLDEGAEIHLQDHMVASRNGVLKEARMIVSGSQKITFTVRLGK
ncbi:glycosyl hydrolase [Paenibacillus taichungensis]|uniref:glycosyl hydrolase n=1 Tax=Paenibacillus taichungensis TaxID=484184 RepID=UPI0039A36346